MIGLTSPEQLQHWIPFPKSDAKYNSVANDIQCRWR